MYICVCFIEQLQICNSSLPFSRKYGCICIYLREKSTRGISAWLTQSIFKRALLLSRMKKNKYKGIIQKTGTAVSASVISPRVFYPSQFLELASYFGTDTHLNNYYQPSFCI